MNLEARPVYFESGSESLFGWLHLPPQNARLDLGIVICKPFGYESVCAHRSIRAFADAGATAGAAVLRFDYTGTGDSSGSDDNNDQVAQWCSDIRAAMQALRELAGVSRIGLLGFRFGALLASMVAAAEPATCFMIAVAPVVSGRRYLRELRAFQATSASESVAAGKATAATGDHSAQTAQGLEVTGFRLSQASVDRLAEIDLVRVESRAVHHALILDRSDLPAARWWADALQTHGTAVSYQTLPGLLEMMATPHEAQVPGEMVAAVTEYLSEFRCRFEIPKIKVSPRQAQWPTSVQLKADDGSKLLERSLFIDDSCTLFGISTELQSDNTCGSKVARHGVVMLNGGATSHIGPNRMYVELARRWAARGYCVLRLDLAGLGDSATRPGCDGNEVYPPGALDDVSAAINYLRKAYGVQHVTLAGLCAGAYHALRSAMSGLHVNTVLLVNPLTFYWKQGTKLGDLQDAEIVRNPAIYAERVLSSKSWRDLLSGRVDVRRVMLICVRRPLLTISSHLRELSRKLNMRFPKDLGWELQTLAERGVRIVFLFARDDVGRALLRLQAGSVVAENTNWCRIHIIDDADHVFSQKPARQELSQLLTSELPR